MDYGRNAYQMKGLRRLIAEGLFNWVCPVKLVKFNWGIEKSKFIHKRIFYASNIDKKINSGILNYSVRDSFFNHRQSKLEGGRAMAQKKQEVMVNGLPGKMATEVAKHILSSEEFSLFLWALTGPDMGEKTEIDGFPVSLISPDGMIGLDREQFSKFRYVLAVDYSQSKAANRNAEFYADCGLSFVMGTTGHDAEEMKKVVEESKVCAVIAPNMGMQIVAFQAAMNYMAETFPGVFSGYSLRIEESHQAGKADTSGTAKAMVKYFNQMGLIYNVEQIDKIRDPKEQMTIGVPEYALTGHGWHTYSLLSPDKSVYFQFTHNVDGRSIYARGTLEALRFLRKKLEAGEKGKVYSMIDVLKSLQ
jgi:4-hydroxy-tetrahydrodipicolinate reductase